MGLESNVPDKQTVTQRQSPELTKRILVIEDDRSVQKILKLLMAGLRAALRRSNLPAMASEVAFDGVVVNFDKMEVTRNGRPISLNAHEFKALRFFVQRLITRAELLNKVCGHEDVDTASRSIDNHNMKLRQKLENDPSRPTHFRTVHTLRYKFAFQFSYRRNWNETHAPWMLRQHAGGCLAQLKFEPRGKPRRHRSHVS
jgi:DNA-binding winged helix-turn-helix (wHTH) protein